MKAALLPLCRRYSVLFGGIALWLALGLSGALHAQVAGLPVLPTIVTWDEWAAAILLLPQMLFWFFGLAISNPERPERWIVLVNHTALAALVVFGLDLVARAIFGLGWKPF